MRLFAPVTTTTVAHAGTTASGHTGISVVFGIVLAVGGIALTVRPVRHPVWRSIVALCLWIAAAWLLLSAVLTGMAFVGAGIAATVVLIFIIWRLDFRPDKSQSEPPPPPNPQRNPAAIELTRTKGPVKGNKTRGYDTGLRADEHEGEITDNKFER